MINQDVVKILKEMAVFYEMDGVLFKPRAYEKAALGVESLGEDLRVLYSRGGKKALLEIPGVGQGIAAHLEQYLKSGHLAEYERFKKKTPVEVSGLLEIEGLGPRLIKLLWQKLGVQNVSELEKAAREGKIRGLRHFGEKSEQKILKGIELLRKSGGRAILGLILPDILRIEKIIQDFPEVEKAVVVGSVRRRKETIGDIDILAVSRKPERVMERFVSLPYVMHVYGRGKTKTLVRLKNGLDADLRVVPKESFGAALSYFTGSKDHNVALREIAQKRGWKLNEYGLYKQTANGPLRQSSSAASKWQMIIGGGEAELYKKLGLRYIEPELREMRGEIEAARRDTLPRLVEFGDLKGDLQIQTDWTDGENSIEEYAKEAESMGLEYIVITDHTKSLAMTGGADEKKLLRQMAAIDEVNYKLKAKKQRVKVLKGAEVNIMKDGTLDIKDEVLKKLDVVGAAIHSHFKMSRDEETRRVVRAMENPNVDIIFHLTTRKINQRDPIELDVDKVISDAKRTGTVLEIDASPERSDIKDEYVRKCVEKGVKMSIDSDAHSAAQMKFLEYGVSQARRGWAEKKDIINAWPLKKMIEFLKK